VGGRRILVTGGAGFVGSHLSERLTEAATVAVLDDFSRGRLEWLPERVAAVYPVDIRDGRAVREAFADFSPHLVIHLAALHFIPAVEGAPELAEAINVGGTANIAAAVQKCPVERVVFASTAAVYPDAAKPLSEEQPVAPIDLYGRTKTAGEALLRNAAAASGAAVSLVRLFNVIGPRETNPHLLPEIVEQLRSGASEVHLGNLETARDFVDVRDVAHAFEVLIARQSARVAAFNVGCGRAVSVSEIVRRSGEILGRHVGVHVDAARTRRIDRKLLVADNRKLVRCGWRPRHSFHQTLTELLACE
jgi:UDP-glucose 4-epimerase